MIKEIRQCLVEFGDACENGQVNPNLAMQLAKSLSRAIHSAPVEGWAEKVTGVKTVTPDEPKEAAPEVEASPVKKVKKAKGRKKKE